MPKTINRFRFFLSVFIFIVVIGFSIYYHKRLTDTLTHVSPGWVVAGMLCHLANYALRAFRLLILSRRRIRFWPDAVYASSFHGFMTYLIPMQLGDISLPIILKTAHEIDLPEGGAILLRSRLLDMMSLGALIVVSALFFNISLAVSIQRFWVSMGVLLTLFPFLFRYLISKGIFHSKRISQFLRPFAQAGGFQIIECLISVVIWISVSCVLYCVIKAVKLPFGFGGALLLITFQLPLQLIPVQGFANTGNHEGGWIAALSLLGIPLKQALESAVASHIIILFYVLVIGVVMLMSTPPGRSGRRPGLTGKL